MEGLNKLTFLPERDKEFITTASRMYKQNARIFFRVHEYNEKKQDVTVKVWQERNNTSKYLSVVELIDRTKDLFNTLPDNVRLHVHARTFLAYGIDTVSLDWIKEQMDIHKLKQVDLVDYLNVPKSTVSEWLGGVKELTNIHKAMFFYLFKSL